MKLTKILATALVALVAMTAAVSAADPGCVLDFTNEANLANFQNGGSGNNVTVTYDATEGAMVFSPSGGDPYINYNLPEELKFDCDANTWCKISYKSTGEIDGLMTQFFWNNTANGGPLGAHQVDWYRDVDGEWIEQVFEMLPNEEGTWTSTLNMLRIDCFQDESSWGDEEMYVKYIAFFASEADANAYTFAPAAAAPETPAEPEAPAVDTTTPAAPSEGAAQTADMASVAVIGLVAAAAVAVISKKR